VFFGDGDYSMKKRARATVPNDAGRRRARIKSKDEAALSGRNLALGPGGSTRVEGRKAYAHTSIVCANDPRLYVIYIETRACSGYCLKSGDELRATSKDGFNSSFVALNSPLLYQP
jgi:hypothetical protein